jgi:hypothetical protein
VNFLERGPLLLFCHQEVGHHENNHTRSKQIGIDLVIESKRDALGLLFVFLTTSYI